MYELLDTLLKRMNQIDVRGQNSVTQMALCMDMVAKMKTAYAPKKKEPKEQEEPKQE